MNHDRARAVLLQLLRQRKAMLREVNMRAPIGSIQRKRALQIYRNEVEALEHAIGCCAMLHKREVEE